MCVTIAGCCAEQSYSHGGTYSLCAYIRHSRRQRASFFFSTSFGRASVRSFLFIRAAREPASVAVFGSLLVSERAGRGDISCDAASYERVDSRFFFARSEVVPIGLLLHLGLIDSVRLFLKTFRLGFNFLFF